MSGRPVVVVTRAADQAGGLAERLRAAGYDVLEVPVIETADPADGGAALASALARLGEYDWLVVTSPNGAARVAPALVAGLHPRLAAVGRATASALGTEVDLIAGDAIGEGLVADFPDGPGRVLLVQAESARPVVAVGLRAKGWMVEAVVGYRTVAVQPPSALLARAAAADAILFTSGSTIRAFLAASGPDGLPPVRVSIGPATSDVAAELGLRLTATAEVHTLDGLVRALGAVLPARDRH